MANAISRARNQAIGYVAKDLQKAPAQTAVAITSGLIGRSLDARVDRSDFAECKRRPGTKPSRHRRGTHRGSGHGRRLVTSSRRRWMRGMGQPSPPRHSEDGSKIRWRGICGTSKDWHKQSECDLETGHEQSWSPDF